MENLEEFRNSNVSGLIKCDFQKKKKDKVKFEVDLMWVKIEFDINVSFESVVSYGEESLYFLRKRKVEMNKNE